MLITGSKEKKQENNARENSNDNTQPKSIQQKLSHRDYYGWKSLNPL